MVRPKESKPRTGEYITVQEYRTILNETYKERNTIRNNRNTTLIQCLWEAALRIGDVLNLNMNQIDFEDIVLKVKPHKTARKKTVVELPMSRELANKIRTLYALNNRTDGKIFTLSYSQARVIVRDYGRSSGITKAVHPHMFRHGIASYLLNDRNVDLKTISEILGHTSITTTANMYIHVTMEKKKTALGLNDAS